ncbi:fos-related antigen 2 [Oncorhynchus tshawytscha]|uniref:BZIP domain-containing protein n=1 Tax=Oncorhynchus tshawytscha TaxID=74940 RepID=A0AAZ3SX46_ONCTS|nr:fos-related antigen 2 [Oncorhynchus tshawytscha]
MHLNHSADHETTLRGGKRSQLELSSDAINSWASSKSQQYPVKMQLPSSSFVPTINAITSSQELQWMIQPAILASKPGHCLPSHPYQPLDISSSLGPGSHTRLGVIRTVGNTHGRSRRSDQLNPAEEERRRLRRERNKLAAAKCRNHRKELTDQLQGETDELEREQACLKTQVERLQEEREKLERMLVSHAPVCLLGCDGHPQAQPLPPPAPTMYPTATSTLAKPLSPPPAIKQEPQEEMLFSFHHHEHCAIKPTCRHVEEYCPSVDSFTTPSMVSCSPARLVDLSCPMLSHHHPSLVGQDRSFREEALPNNLLSKPLPGSDMSLEDGLLGPRFSANLLTL